MTIHLQKIWFDKGSNSEDKDEDAITLTQVELVIKNWINLELDGSNPEGDHADHADGDRS